MSGPGDAGSEASARCSITASSQLTLDTNQVDPGSPLGCASYVEIDTAKAQDQGCKCTTSLKTTCTLSVACDCTDPQQLGSASYDFEVTVSGSAITGTGSSHIINNNGDFRCAFSNVGGKVD